MNGAIVDMQMLVPWVLCSACATGIVASAWGAVGVLSVLRWYHQVLRQEAVQQSAVQGAAARGQRLWCAADPCT
jgi:hypothetical protein